MASDITIIRSKRKTLSLHVLSDLSIEVKAPYLVPKFVIQQFVEKNSAWIEKRRALLKKQHVASKSYSDGEKFFYLGNYYSLKSGKYDAIKIDNENLLFPEGILFRAKKELENWYIKQAKELITAQTIFFAQQMRTSFSGISFSDTRSQWGSCSHTNKLQFSWRLIMTPLLVVNYVIIHELAHTVEKNHSASFWDVVRSQMPSYKQQIKWLKTNGNTLVV